MKITKTENILTEITTDIQCNKCGESCKKSFNLERESFCDSYYGLIEVSVEGGYLSEELEDLTNYTFSLCEACLKNLFDSFKLPIKITYRENY